jgi:hypothetical protein
VLDLYTRLILTKMYAILDGARVKAYP